MFLRVKVERKQGLRGQGLIKQVINTIRVITPQIGNKLQWTPNKPVRVFRRIFVILKISPKLIISKGLLNSPKLTLILISKIINNINQINQINKINKTNKIIKTNNINKINNNNNNNNNNVNKGLSLII